MIRKYILTTLWFNVSKILEVRLIIAFCDLVIRRKSKWWTSWRDGGDTSIHHGSTCMNRNQTVTNVIWRISNMILLILQKFQYTVGKSIRDLKIIHSIVDGFGLYLYEPSSDCYRCHLTNFKHVAKKSIFQLRVDVHWKSVLEKCLWVQLSYESL